MRHTHLILLILVLASGCSSGPGVRLGSAYFPLYEGASWIYSVSSGGTAEILMEGQGDSTYHTAINGVPYLFQRLPDGIYNIKDEYQTINGEKIEFGTFYEFYLPDPPIDGTVVEDSILSTKFYYGDTLRFLFKYRIGVYYTGNMKVGDNLFHEVYRVTRMEIRNSDTLTTTEWYAPEIGMIKREEGEDIWEIREWLLP